MRTPIRSEPEAFRFVFAGALVAGLAVLVGWLLAPLAGVAVFALAIALGAIAYLRAPNPDRRTPLHDAAHASHPHGPTSGARHVLIVANEVLSGAELRDRIVDADGQRIEVDVLAPVLTTHLHYGVSDIDRELELAHARLERSLAWVREQDIAVHGEVGDASPTTAIEDELRDFGADEVIVVTHARERAGWQERGEIERLRRELDLPVTHIVVDGAGGAQSD